MTSEFYRDYDGQDPHRRNKYGDLVANGVALGCIFGWMLEQTPPQTPDITLQVTDQYITENSGGQEFEIVIGHAMRDVPITARDAVRRAASSLLEGSVSGYTRPEGHYADSITCVDTDNIADSIEISSVGFRCAISYHTASRSPGAD